jgi:hypothetical protein
MAGYSATTDLLTGDLPLPSYVSPQKFVDDAADEINSKIGFLYQVPVDLNAEAVKTPVKLLLKRINNFLASGRLIMMLTQSQEDTRLHAYGYSLVADATAALAQIASGELVLELPKPAGSETEIAVTAPLIYNQDAESAVEAFYDRVANPNYCFGYFYGIPRNTDPGIIR